jgi:hypothetical protein
LSDAEKLRIKTAVEKEKKNIWEQAERKYDSSKNWSIMIKDEDNEVRNEIMRRVAAK